MRDEALIVDDSKTARVTLQKMLKKHDVDAAVVDSGEEALRYLQDHSPKMIFMDHMMPGMDGFETVKEIKADTRKAHIPIIMYTTRASEGHIYVGQAKALGACDILPKPPKLDELHDVLERIQQREQTRGEVAVTIEMPSVEEEPITQTSTTLKAITEEQVTAHSSASSTIMAYGPLRQLLAAVLLLAPVLWLLALYIPAEQQRASLQHQSSSLLRSLEWAVNQSAAYDFGEAPMGGQRLALLEGLVTQLSLSGFKGQVRLQGHVGDFCLVNVQLADGAMVTMLPDSDMPLSNCHTIGLSSADALAESTRRSAAFESFLGQSPVLRVADITIETVGFGATQPAFDYPEALAGQSAGDWNAAALKNNRVNFMLIAEQQASEESGWQTLFSR